MITSTNMVISKNIIISTIKALRNQDFILKYRLEATLLAYPYSSNFFIRKTFTDEYLLFDELDLFIQHLLNSYRFYEVKFFLSFGLMSASGVVQYKFCYLVYHRTSGDDYKKQVKC